ncbi:MAG: hypothetical protein KBS56_06590 [Clostridiales bacterium]|nr:hypothetical protein [Candidatus Crickella equi]
MKKFLVVMLSLMMVFAMCACGEKEESSEVANPVIECTYDELIEKGGVDIKAPENAEDVQYSYIEADGQEMISQVAFTVDGKEFCYRAQPTGITNIMANTDGTEVSMDKLVDALNDGTQIGAALSGLNYEWSACASVDVDYCEGICAFNEGEAGFIAWLDVAPGILYSLGMDNGCTQDLLMDTANDIFVPVQGNVG